MYCVKCKQKTESTNIIQTTTSGSAACSGVSASSTAKNNRSMLKGVCSICGSKKSQFIKNITPSVRPLAGKGIGDTIIKAIGKVGELHLLATKGEYVPNGSFNDLKKYSYCGPGTQYEQRAREGYQGINELDSMCKLHDKFYNENLDAQSRNISDAALAHRANEIVNHERFDEEQRRFARFVKIIMNNKVRFGLGLGVKLSKNVKKGSMLLAPLKN